MNTCSIPGHSKITILKFSLIFCEIFHLVGKKVSCLCTKNAFFIMLTFTLKKSVTMFVYFITLLHQYTISAISPLRRKLGQSDNI